MLAPDDLSCLPPHQTCHVSRASHVEPCDLPDGRKAWTADLSPVRGPTLGPFSSRKEAVEAEQVWLTEHLHLLDDCNTKYRRGNPFPLSNKEFESAIFAVSGSPNANIADSLAPELPGVSGSHRFNPRTHDAAN